MTADEWMNCVPYAYAGGGGCNESVAHPGGLQLRYSESNYPHNGVTSYTGSR